MPYPPQPHTTKPIVVVMPCFNEQHRFRADTLAAFASASPHIYFLLVNDGSTDDTAAMLDKLAAQVPEAIGVLHLEENRGKAEAVRRGMVQALQHPSVDMVGYWDADLATPLSSIPTMAAVLQDKPGLDVVLGSRVKLLGRTIERRAIRHYLGRVFATMASLVIDLPVYDTQCGAKMFRVGPRLGHVLGEPFGSRWVFDLELLARFLKQGGKPEQVYELPLDEWRDVAGSKVRPVDFARAIGETASLYRNYRLPQRYARAFDILTAPFVRYFGAGAVGTVLHYTILTLSVELLDLGPVAGAIAGATGGAMVNYWINYHFTFVSRQRHGHTLPKFLTVAAAGIALNAWIVQAITARGLHYLVGQLLATAAVLVLGFIVNRLWTFSK